MRHCALLPAAAVLMLLLAGWLPVHAQSPRKSESFVWQKSTPKKEGMSRAKLDALRNDLAKRRTKALLVIRNDKIVYEWYAPKHGANKRHYTASLVKAIVAGLMLMLGLQDGKFDLDDPASKYIPAWRDDPKKSKITLRQLATHSSGISDAEHGRPGWESAFWKRQPDPFTVARDKAPLLFKPGSRFQYSNPGMAMLAYAITASYKGKKGTDHRTMLKERIMDPIGVPASAWSIGYGKTYKVDGLKLVANWGGGAYTTRAVARVGRLMLRKGNWQGKQLIDAKLVQRATRPAGTPKPDRSKGEPWPASGLGWWVNADGVWPKVPRDAFAGAGAGHQILLVVPSQKLIVVRMGGSLSGLNWGRGFWGAAETFLFNPLMETVVDRKKSPTPDARQSCERHTECACYYARSQAEPRNEEPRRVAGTLRVPSAKERRAPYPPSQVITGIRWAAKSTIIRKAKGSDNWPLTWADDGNLYTAYGDGRGFKPYTPKKLGMGFAKILGMPPKFQGINIRSPANESRGFGANGKKASGMLMVDGVLYMLARNAGNSQLAWSSDHGKTWTWSKWNFTTSFGCPTFLNFGKNYAGARDDYVYIYSHDSDSAYKAADRMVLARVHRKQIRQRRAYEFLRKLDAKSQKWQAHSVCRSCGTRSVPATQPLWTKDIRQRGAVFTHPGKCYRSGISYNAALKRYLWCQVLPKSHDNPDPRFRGGLGIFDAPEPWGPWTTVYFTELWDTGPGESASFPTKWISRDGRTLHLVFSGDDYFSVRRVFFIP